MEREKEKETLIGEEPLISCLLCPNPQSFGVQNGAPTETPGQGQTNSEAFEAPGAKMVNPESVFSGPISINLAQSICSNRVIWKCTLGCGMNIYIYPSQLSIYIN